MKVRLCKKCFERSANLKILDTVIGLAERGSWLCPNGKTDCGTVKGKTQEELRKLQSA